MSEFTKFDQAKEVFALLDPRFEAELAAILTHGAKKYADDNWKQCKTPWRTYYSALRRHLNAVARGEQLDPDSGMPHLACCACNVMFLAWFQRNGGFEAAVGGGAISPADGAEAAGP